MRGRLYLAALQTGGSDGATNVAGPVISNQRRRRGIAVEWALVSVILLAAATFRLAGVSFGDPFVYHPDEWLTAKPAMGMVRTGTWNPRLFLYPSALTYAERTVVSISHAITGAPLTTAVDTTVAGLPERDGSNALPEQFPYFLWGRVLVASLGVLTVLVTYLAARHVSGTIGAFAAAAIVAGDPLHVVHSHYLTPDVPTSLFTALTVLLALLGARENPRWLIAAGFAAGLAASTKYNGGLVVIVPLVVYLGLGDGWPSIARRAVSRTTVAIAVASVVGFVAGTPAIIFDPGAVAAGIQAQAVAYTAGHAGSEGSNNWLFNLRYLFTSGLGPGLSVLVVAGFAICVIRRRSETTAILVFSFAYFALVSIPVVRFERNLVPLVPCLAIVAGVFVGHVLPPFKGWCRRRDVLPLFAGSVLAIVLVGVGLVQGASTSVRFDRMLLLPDSRTVALDWIEMNLPAGSRIVREQFTPQIPSGKFGAAFIYTLASHPLAWYRDRGVEYLVASSFNIDRFGAAYPVQNAFYSNLLRLPIVYEVAPGAPDQGLTGPKVVVVRLAAD
jgi:4-amino-4-deoxy-L-arabinose transferase-like glycosyltransferase